MMGYRSQLYIDVPFDASLPAFHVLQAYGRVIMENWFKASWITVCCPGN